MLLEGGVGVCYPAESGLIRMEERGVVRWIQKPSLIKNKLYISGNPLNMCGHFDHTLPFFHK